MVGIGQIPCQLNGGRLYLPRELQGRLGALLRQEWLVSYWSDGCLRVVHRDLWPDYLNHIRGVLASVEGAAATQEFIVQSAKTIRMDQGGRWNLPKDLAAFAGITERAECLLVSNTAWIEVWLRSAREDKIRQLLIPTGVSVQGCRAFPQLGA